MNIRHVLADHGIEYTSRESFEVEIVDLVNRLTDLNQFVTGAFADGMIETMEAKKIEIYINQLIDTNRKVTERYLLLMDNTALDLESAERAELKTAKDLYDVRIDALISVIELAISDGKSTREEANAVDEAYINMIEASARLEAAFQKASDYILGKRTKLAEDNAKSYADDLKSVIDKETAELAKELREYEGYLNGAFRDGIVSEFEAKNIQSYVATVRMQKTDIDRQVEFLINNPFLESGIPARINLEDAYRQYNESHNRLLTLIELVIEDAESTPEEAAEVQQQFVNLDDKLKLLVTCMQIAAESIAQLRADTAENLAREFAAEVAGEKAKVAEEAAKAYTEEKAEWLRLQTEALADGILTEEEKAAIEAARQRMDNAETEMERLIEEARQATEDFVRDQIEDCLLYTSPSPRD